MTDQEFFDHAMIQIVAGSVAADYKNEVDPEAHVNYAYTVVLASLIKRQTYTKEQSK